MLQANLNLERPTQKAKDNRTHGVAEEQLMAAVLCSIVWWNSCGW